MFLKNKKPIVYISKICIQFRNEKLKKNYQIHIFLKNKKQDEFTKLVNQQVRQLEEKVLEAKTCIEMIQVQLCTTM